MSSPELAEIGHLGTVSSTGWPGREKRSRRVHLGVWVVEEKAGQGRAEARGRAAVTTSRCGQGEAVERERKEVVELPHHHAKLLGHSNSTGKQGNGGAASSSEVRAPMAAAELGFRVGAAAAGKRDQGGVAARYK